MSWSATEILGAGCIALALAAAPAMPPANAAGERPLFVSLGAATRAPIGWTDFCASYAGECETSPLEPRDIVLSSKAWKDLVRINTSVNDTVKPITDLEHGARSSAGIIPMTAMVTAKTMCCSSAKC